MTWPRTLIDCCNRYYMAINVTFEYALTCIKTGTLYCTVLCKGRYACIYWFKKHSHFISHRSFMCRRDWLPSGPDFSDPPSSSSWWPSRCTWVTPESLITSTTGATCWWDCCRERLLLFSMWVSKTTYSVHHHTTIQQPVHLPNATALILCEALSWFETLWHFETSSFVK